MEAKDTLGEIRQALKKLCATDGPISIFDLSINNLDKCYGSVIDAIFLEFKESPDIVYNKNLLTILISTPEEALESNYIALATLSYLGEINLTMREKLILCRRVFEMCGPSVNEATK